MLHIHFGIYQMDVISASEKIIEGRNIHKEEPLGGIAKEFERIICMIKRSSQIPWAHSLLGLKWLHMYNIQVQL